MSSRRAWWRRSTSSSSKQYRPMSRKVLLVSATGGELRDYLGQLGVKPPRIGELAQLGDRLTLLLTGVGASSMALALGQQDLSTYDMVLCAGFAGAYTRELSVGEAVLVGKDRFWDYGLWRGNTLVPLERAGLPQLVEPSGGYFHATSLEVKGMRTVYGNTVSHPTEGRIAFGTFAPEGAIAVESMEGAAFAMACQLAGVESVSLRVVSNYCETRDKAEWNIALARERLAGSVDALLTAIG